MQVLLGKPIMDQIVAGRLCFYRRPVPQVQLYTQGDWRQEINRFHRAQQISILELNTLYHRALNQVGEGVASIFLIHGMLLEDHDYVETVRGLINGQGVTAEYAVQMAEVSFSAAFSAMDSLYMQARAADIRDISRRMLRALMGGRQTLLMDEPAILVSDDYLPSEVMDFDQRHLLGLITRKGSLDSHTAMLVRAYHIPAIVEVPVLSRHEGRLALMDGYTGQVYIDPDQEQMDNLRELYQANGRPKSFSLAAR
ncbi:MAG: phosphoenolpyruvate--protein phosphotransferase [Lawsonibacter sp.]|jgi:phosphoenolpyruvate-protein kinase (PTS system EI component)|nr:phosphoenolpyruvate--protein phosphotransferase [Lawsonibacter sp.]